MTMKYTANSCAALMDYEGWTDRLDKDVCQDEEVKAQSKMMLKKREAYALLLQSLGIPDEAAEQILACMSDMLDDAVELQARTIAAAARIIQEDDKLLGALKAADFLAEHPILDKSIEGHER